MSEIMMLSRVPMTEEIVQIFFLQSTCALPSHTSVPCESPETCKRSAKVCGLVSMSIPCTNPVPISGMPSVPIGERISAGVAPSGSVEVKSLYTSGSFMGTSMTLVPVNRSIILYFVGISCPSSSSLSSVSCRYSKVKCVVTMLEFGSSAGCCTGVKSYISFSFGTTTIPPGCCPVVRFTPTQCETRRSISAFVVFILCSSRYLRT